MNLFKYILPFFIFFFLLLQGCSSPLDVPANRRIDIEENPYLNPIIKLNPNYLFFDFVHPDSTKILTIEIENNQDKKYLITNYYLFHANNNFSILNKEIPVILEAKGQENSKKKIDIKFTGKSAGVFVDSLIFANIFYPFGFLEAKVPYIYINDFYKSNLKIGNKVIFELTITNFSENTATINKLNFIDNNIDLVVKNSFPIELPRNSQKKLLLECLPNKSGTHISQAQLEIVTNSSRKLVDSIATIKIDCN